MHEMQPVTIKRCYRYALERFWGRSESGRELVAAALEKSKDTIDAYAAFGNPRIPWAVAGFVDTELSDVSSLS